jgi:hypothetical protein
MRFVNRETELISSWKFLIEQFRTHWEECTMRKLKIIVTGQMFGSGKTRLKSGYCLVYRLQIYQYIVCAASVKH